MFTLQTVFSVIFLILLNSFVRKCDAVKEQTCAKDSKGCDNENFGEEKEEIRLFLIGKTGSGKSETGNTILGKEMFETSPLLSSKTKTCTLKRNLRNGTMIEVLDTVGFFDTHKTMIETVTALVTAVVAMHPGPHAILYVLKIERFTNEVMDTYNIFKNYFDDAISNYTILVLTHGDALERKRLTLDDVMKTAPETFRSLCAEVNNRVVIFNNIAENKDNQVNRLLQVVRAMMLENRNIPYSSSKYAYAGYLVDKVIDLRMMITAKPSSSDVISSSHQKDEDRGTEVRTQKLHEREITLNEKEKQLKLQQELKERENLLNILQKELLQKEEEMIKRRMQEMKEREERERTLKEKEDKIITQERKEEMKRKEREEEMKRKEREEEIKRKEREEREREDEKRREYRRHFKDEHENKDSFFWKVVKTVVNIITFFFK